MIQGVMHKQGAQGEGGEGRKQNTAVETVALKKQKKYVFGLN